MLHSRVLHVSRACVHALSLIRSEVKSAIVLNVVFQISVLIIIYNLHRLTYKYHRLVQNNSDKPGELPAVERCVVDEDEEDEEEVMFFMAILLVQGQKWLSGLHPPLVLRRIFHEAHFRFIYACPIVCLFVSLFYFLFCFFVNLENDIKR